MRREFLEAVALHVSMTVSDRVKLGILSTYLHP